MQPLPFFTSIHQAASFMGRSRVPEEEEEFSPWGDKAQDAFLLQKARLPIPGEELEFETVPVGDDAMNGT
jgi:hypothetical protein